tara:strand:- start:296 stop:1171 length:876 start_codon:yes stop_codon:yes gene_type:complete
MSKKLTIVIPTYKSHKIIFKLLKTISKTYKIIVIENSFDNNFKNRIEKKYLNVKVYLKKNIGFGRAINFAAKKIKTRYFIAINPDTIIYKNTLTNLLKAAEKMDIFGAIGPTHINFKNNKNKDFYLERDNLNGPINLFQTKTFKKIKGYDDKIFLYFEDNDYYKKCNILNLKLYLIRNSSYNHSKPIKYNKSLNVKSSSFSNVDEKNYSYFVGGWHGQWSKFYYLKKYNGFFKALIKCTPNVILNTFQLIIYCFINQTKAKHRYFKIEGFLCSLIGMSSFKRSKFDLDNYN